MNENLDKRGMSNTHTILAIAVALVLIASAAWYFFTSGRVPGAEDNALGSDNNIEIGDNNIGIELGQIAPDFTLTDIDGKTFSLSDYRGKVVVIDLMATWCGPCVAEMSHLKELYTNYRARGVVIMSIDVDPSERNEVIRQFKANYGDEWIFASGPGVGTTYGVLYIPTLYIIDKQGRIAYKNVGLTPYSTLAGEIDKLL